MVKSKAAMIIFIMSGFVVTVSLIYTFIFPSTLNMNMFAKRVKLEQYLEKECGKKSIDGDVFVAYEVIGSNKKDNVIELYVWLLCEEYKKMHSRPELGTAINVPVAVYIKKNDYGYKIIGHKIPDPKGNYEKDIKEIFPEAVQNKIFLGHNACNELALKLTKQIDKKRLAKFE